VVARVRKSGGAHQALGFVLNDGTPLKSVEVQIDNGPWQTATLDPFQHPVFMEAFTYLWEGAMAGEHILDSRATDLDGTVRPVAARPQAKKDVPRRHCTVSVPVFVV